MTDIGSTIWTVTVFLLGRMKELAPLPGIAPTLPRNCPQRRNRSGTRGLYPRKEGSQSPQPHDLVSSKKI